MTFSQPTAGRQQTLPAEPRAHAQTGARRAGLRSHRGGLPARRQTELSDSSQASSLLSPQRLTAAVSLKWPQSPTRQSLPLRPPNSPPSLAAPSVGTHLGPAHGPASPPGDPHPTSKPLLTCDPSAGSVTPAPCHFPWLVSCHTCHTAVGFAASLLVTSPAQPHPRPPQDKGLSPSRPDPHAGNCAHRTGRMPEPDGGRARYPPFTLIHPHPQAPAQTRPSPGHTGGGGGQHTWPHPCQPDLLTPLSPTCHSGLNRLKI